MFLLEMEDNSTHVDNAGKGGVCLNCVICLMPLGEDSVKLFQKGLTTLIEVSGLRDDIDFRSQKLS